MKTLNELQPFTFAEKKLLQCCSRGETAELDSNQPERKTSTNEIRADFLRCLIIEKNKSLKIDPKGIRFSGAWVSGKLDLNGITTPYPFHFTKSVFDDEIILLDADIRTLDLEGCSLFEGLRGDRVHVHSSVMFRIGFKSNKQISLIAAKIDGSLTCKAGVFNTNKDHHTTLMCNRAEIQGSVYLNEKFTSNGMVSFNSARISHDMKCGGGIFNNTDGCALSLHSMYVEDSIYFDETTVIKGSIDLSGSYIDSLVEIKDDDTVFDNNKIVWFQDTINYIYLDGLKYNHIYGPTNAKFRISWLSKIPNNSLKPQPWKQLAKVLRDMGHDEEADYIMIAFHDKKLELKKNKSKELKISVECKKNIFTYCLMQYLSYLKSILYYKFSYLFKSLYGVTSKYGYRPMRTLLIMTIIWLSFGFVYWYAATVAVFAPSNPLIFMDQNKTCNISSNGTPWLSSPIKYNATNNWYYAAPGEYTTFQPLWYSLDVILPVVDLQMEKDWGTYIPTPSGDITDLIPFTTLNHTIRFFTWIENLLGWILSLILVAILSGLAKNEKE